MTASVPNPEGPRRRAPAWLAGTLVFALAVGGLLAASAVVRPEAPDGLHLQEWSSDRMMQTLPASELRRDPIGALWYLHKQPPGLDAIRAVIANLAPEGVDLAWFVDTWMYRVWAGFYGFTALLVFRWIRRRTSTPVAAFAAIAWVLHPAAIANATFLESTALSSLLILWMFFELSDADSSVAASIRLTAAAVLLVYTRTVFQWYFVPVFAACLWLRRVPWRRAVAMCAVMGLLTGALVGKQYLLFATTSTSTFTGFHHCGVIWYKPTAEDTDRVSREVDFVYPRGAAEISDPENTRKNALLNVVYSRICRSRVIDHPAESMEAVRRSAVQNLEKYFRPSSRYQRNLLVDSLPWRGAYDFIFSGGMLVGLFALCAFIQLGALRASPRPRETIRKWSAYALPFLYVFAVSNLGNRYGWVETDRLKFLLEPVFFVFLASSLAALVAGRASPKGSTANAKPPGATVPLRE